MSKKKTPTDKQMKAAMKKVTNLKSTLQNGDDGPKEVRTAVTKLTDCEKSKKNCDKLKKNLRTSWSRKCYRNKKTEKTDACTAADKALKKGKYKFHPVYGYLRY